MKIPNYLLIEVNLVKEKKLAQILRTWKDYNDTPGSFSSCSYSRSLGSIPTNEMNLQFHKTGQKKSNLMTQNNSFGFYITWPSILCFKRDFWNLQGTVRFKKQPALETEQIPNPLFISKILQSVVFTPASVKFCPCCVQISWLSPDAKSVITVIAPTVRIIRSFPLQYGMQSYNHILHPWLIQGQGWYYFQCNGPNITVPLP